LNSVTRIVLVRHGATEWNETKRAQGQANPPLTPLGRAQAQSVVEALARVEIDAVYSSDLDRAVDTARPLAEERGLEVICDSDFREIDQGQWTGLQVDEIKAMWPERWGPARHYTRRPGGEAPWEVRARALEALGRVVKEHPDATVVVVSHGGTIRWIVAEAMGYSDDQSARLRGLSNGGAVVLDARADGDGLSLSFIERLDGREPDLDDPND
jgi:broad specificity phosphatase PhoE